MPVASRHFRLKPHAWSSLVRRRKVRGPAVPESFPFRPERGRKQKLLQDRILNMEAEAEPGTRNLKPYVPRAFHTPTLFDGGVAEL